MYIHPYVGTTYVDMLYRRPVCLPVIYSYDVPELCMNWISREFFAGGLSASSSTLYLLFVSWGNKCKHFSSNRKSINRTNLCDNWAGGDNVKFALTYLDVGNEPHLCWRKHLRFSQWGILLYWKPFYSCSQLITYYIVQRILRRTDGILRVQYLFLYIKKWSVKLLLYIITPALTNTAMKYWIPNKYVWTTGIVGGNTTIATYS